eukprot:6646887-Pyramimonas_sp.AAC.1
MTITGVGSGIQNGSSHSMLRRRSNKCMQCIPPDTSTYISIRTPNEDAVPIVARISQYQQ